MTNENVRCIMKICCVTFFEKTMSCFNNWSLKLTEIRVESFSNFMCGCTLLLDLNKRKICAHLIIGEAQ